MNNKGFTLVELLGTLAILGIILLISIPSINNVVEKNKKLTFINDAKRFIALAEADARKNSYKYNVYTLDNNCTTTVSFNEYEKNSIKTSDLEKSPYDNKYLCDSWVFVCQIDSRYYYIVYLTDGQKSIIAYKSPESISVPNKIKDYNNINEKDEDKRVSFIVDYQKNQDSTILDVIKKNGYIRFLYCSINILSFIWIFRINIISKQNTI